MMGSKADSFHKRVLENLSTAVVMLNEQLGLEYMNPAAEMLFEASIRQASKLPLEAWFDASSDQLRELKEALESGHPYTRRESRVRTFSGHELTVDYSVNPLPDRKTPYLLMEIQARDRLMRIEREEELLSRHATARNLVRGLAHEIKNPLGGIRGAAQLLERELENPELHEYTRVVIEEADRLRNLVDRLLGPRKVPNMGELNIHALLERVCNLIEAESGGRIRLERDYDPSIPELVGDAEQLIQALLNIARNAMQALLRAKIERPRLTITTRAKRQVTLGTEKHRLVCLVTIEDNGPGVPREIINQIFYPMVSGRADGTGLGLSISQSIINQHRGLIECRSRPGRTKFEVFIPFGAES